jgi:hypothetical protein
MQRTEAGNQETSIETKAIGRRYFMSLLGATAGVALLAGCKKDDEETAGPAIDMGSGDEGLMRYAYSISSFMALAGQLATEGRQAIAEETANFSTLWRFHTVYTDLFKAQLGGNVPENLQFDTTKIAFGDKNRVHENLITFTDLVTSAYMDMALRFSDPVKKQLAAKIASANARLSTRIRWTRNNNWPDRTANDTESMDLGVFNPKTPQQVVNALNVFLITKLNVSQIS